MVKFVCDERNFCYGNGGFREETWAVPYIGVTALWPSDKVLADSCDSRDN